MSKHASPSRTGIHHYRRNLVKRGVKRRHVGSPISVALSLGCVCSALGGCSQEAPLTLVDDADVRLSAQPNSQSVVFTNALDFDGLSHVHIDFEAASGQGSLEDINAFLAFQPIEARFISWDRQVRSVSATDAHDPQGLGILGGYDGGPVTGCGHLWGSPNDVPQFTLTFPEPVDAVGYFFGGVHSPAFMQEVLITFADGSTRFVNEVEMAAIYPLTPDGTSSAKAISGFFGIDAAGGPGIVAVEPTWHQDQQSIDDIFYGTADAGSHGPGPTGFTENVGGCDSVSPDVQLPGLSLAVEIDIKPGSDPNCFNNDGNGVIPVAIFGTSTLDVNDIDANSLRLEGLSVGAVGNGDKLLARPTDVDGDGIEDLLVQIQDEDGVWEPGAATATLTGVLLDGTPIEGSDEICITQ